MERAAIKRVLEKMGFTVKCTDTSTKFSRGKFSWKTDEPLEKVDLELLTIYYGDSRVMESSGGPTNGWQ